MKTWVRKTLAVGVLAAGALLLAPSAAQADVMQDSSDNNGAFNGTQIVAPINVPANVVGNAIGVGGEANAAGAGSNWWSESGMIGQDSSDNNGVGNGGQAYLPVNVPLNIVGNAGAILGEGNAAGAGSNGGGGQTESGRIETTRTGGGAGQTSTDNNGVGNGGQIYSPVEIPVNLCGNALSILGEANAQAVCVNSGGGTESGHVMQDSSDNNGVGNGGQAYAPITLPVNLSGNAVSVGGESNAAAASANGGHGGTESQGMQDSSDNNGALNGGQLQAPVHVPVNVCGNAISVLGEANASAACANGGTDGNDVGGDNGDDTDQGDDTGHDDGDDVGGDNGSDDPYGSDSESEGGRTAKRATTAATEASPVTGLTDTLSGVGNVGGLGGLLGGLG